MLDEAEVRDVSQPEGYAKKRRPFVIFAWVVAIVAVIFAVNFVQSSKATLTVGNIVHNDDKLTIEGGDSLTSSDDIYARFEVGKTFGVTSYMVGIEKKEGAGWISLGREFIETNPRYAVQIIEFYEKYEPGEYMIYVMFGEKVKASTEFTIH